MDFDRHTGKTLPQVLFCDPEWFFWAIENQVFTGKGRTAREAADLDRKARRIRIPDQEGSPLVAEYVFSPDGKFSHLRLVPISASCCNGSSVILRRTVIDLSIPRQIGRYDKGGYRRLLSNLRYLLFGDSRAKMTRQRCEAFYQDPSHFA